MPQDDAQAAYWYRKGAEQDDAAGHYSLGLAYANGRGVPQDDELAAHWYRKAAEQEVALAQFNLGVAYATGHSVPQDDEVEAHKWMNLAAARASGGEQERFADERDAIAAKMTTAEIAEAQQRAKDWTDARLAERLGGVRPVSRSRKP